MKYGPLAAQLRAASARGDRVVEYSFHDIDGLVGGLPASARTNRTWWANASRVQSLAWRDAGWHVEMVSLERERVRFERGARGGSCADRGRVSTYAAGQLAAPVVERTPAASPAETSVVDAVLVGCVKTKARRPLPAGDLYRSPLFERRRAYAEASGASWYLLSSKWGLIEPDTVVAPYDLYLGDQPASYRRVWGAFVVEQLAALTALRPGTTIEVHVEVHAGASYVDPLRKPLADRGAVLIEPIEASSLGEILHWYDVHSPHSAPGSTPAPKGDVVATVISISTAYTALADSAGARTPEQILASDRSELGKPGLFPGGSTRRVHAT